MLFPLFAMRLGSLYTKGRSTCYSTSISLSVPSYSFVFLRHVISSRLVTLHFVLQVFVVEVLMCSF
jgi:hypothetical protein